MKDHFLKHSGEWSGDGFITFSKLQHCLPFTVSWTISQLDEQRTRAIQRITLQDSTPTLNTYIVIQKSDTEFELLLENKDLGVFSGKGVCDSSQIAWEFAHFGSLEGMEIYQKESEEEYSFKGEYTGGEDYTTKIEGRLRYNA